MKKLSRVFAALLVSVLLFGVAGVAAAATVKIGVVEELTGGVATYGQHSLNGMKLAVDEVNAKGGIKGLGKIQLVIEDNKSDAAETVNAYNKLITRDRVVALIGPATSTNTLAAGPIAQRAGIPVITPSGTAVKVTDVGNYIFRACFIDPFQGYVMANFAYKDKKFRRVALLPEITSDYAMGRESHQLSRRRSADIGPEDRPESRRKPHRPSFSQPDNSHGDQSAGVAKRRGGGSGQPG